MLLVVGKSSFVNLSAQVDLSSMTLHSVLHPAALAYEIVANVHTLSVSEVSAISIYYEFAEVDVRLVLCKFGTWPASTEGSGRDDFNRDSGTLRHDFLD